MIKDLLRARRGSGFLLPVFEEYLVRQNMVSDGRRTGVFHPSEISGKNFCPRQWCLIEANPKLRLRKKEISPGLRFRFAIGTAVHEMIQQTLGKTGKLFGWWRCPYDADPCRVYGFMPEYTCPHMKEDTPSWRYEEVEVWDPELLIYGHTDGIVVLGAAKYDLEIKTINESGFRTLLEPLEAHKEQASLYLAIMERQQPERVKKLEKRVAAGERSLQPVLDVERLPFSGVIFWYINKGNQPENNIRETIKEFVLWNGPEIQAYRESKGKETEPARRWYLNGKCDEDLPEPICQTLMQARMRKCPIADVCLGGGNRGKAVGAEG